MLSPISIGIVILSVILLLASGYWTNRRYAQFSELPGHYDLRGRATRMSPRSVMAWLLPITFSVCLTFFAVLFEVTPPQIINGDPNVGVLVMVVTLLGCQGLVLWLLGRWAASQDQ